MSPTSSTMQTASWFSQSLDTILHLRSTFILGITLSGNSDSLLQNGSNGGGPGRYPSQGGFSRFCQGKRKP